MESAGTTAELDQYDVFVCHASEDKERFVGPLVHALEGLQVRVWADWMQIAAGDNITERIDDGLRRAHFGVVVLSPRFWKYWTTEEVNALITRESLDRDRRRIIVPVWCEVDLADVAVQTPLLAGRRAIPWGNGVDAVAREIADVVGRTRSTPPPRPGFGRSPLYNLPARLPSAAFTGRDVDLAEVDRLLTQGARVRVAASVEGLMGVGKTELVLQLVYRLARTSRFPGGIFWLDAQQGDLRPQWGGPIADRLAVGSADLDERTRAALRIVESGGDALIVLDNLSHWTSDLMPQPIPRGANVALLATSQVRGIGGSDFEQREISVLPPAAGRTLMLRLIGEARGTDDGLDELLAFLDGHPLAICLAGAYLRAFADADARRYFEGLQRGEPVEDDVKDLPRYEATVRAALKAATDRLTDNDRKALLVASWFADADASVGLFRATGVPSSSERTLRDLHLIAGDAKRWSMHRLIRHYTRLGADEAALRLSRQAFWLGCRSMIDQAATRVAAYRHDQVHLHALAERAIALDGVPPPVALSVLERVGGAARAAGDLASAMRYLDANAALRQKLGQDQRAMFSSIQVAQIMPDGAAVPLMSPFVLTELEHARARLDAAWVQVQAGLYSEALAEAQRVLVILRRELPPYDEVVQSATEVRVSSLLGLEQYSKAEAIAKELLRAVEAQFGADSLRASRARLFLAQSLRRSERRALRELDRATEAIAGKSHPEALTLRSDLIAHRGYLMERRGHFADARELVSRAANMSVDALGHSHSDTLTKLVNLAVITMKCGDVVAARRMVAALELRVVALQATHPVAICYRGLEAEIWSAAGDHEMAERAAAIALAAARSRPQDDRLRRNIESDIVKMRKTARRSKSGL